MIEFLYESVVITVKCIVGGITLGVIGCFIGACMAGIQMLWEGWSS